MAVRLDMFGYRYDDSVPSFIIIPYPYDEEGGPKLVYHRPTLQLYDMGELQEMADDKGYDLTDPEIGEDPDWIRGHTDFDPDHRVPPTPPEPEYTLTAVDDPNNNGNQQAFVFSGPEVATHDQTIKFGVLTVDGLETRPSTGDGVISIAAGDTFATVKSKVSALNYTSDEADSESGTMYASWKFLNTSDSQYRMRVSEQPSSQAVSWYQPFDIGVPQPFAEGLIVEWDGAFNVPLVTVTHEMAPDSLSFTINFTSPTGDGTYVRGYPTGIWQDAVYMAGTKARDAKYNSYTASTTLSDIIDDVRGDYFIYGEYGVSAAVDGLTITVTAKNGIPFDRLPKFYIT